MARCPSCGNETPASHRFCGACGMAVSVTSAPTETERLAGDASPVAGVREEISSGSSDRARFLPGTLLAGRYRIFGLVGRGGMGEVYRADDLKLGQVVALKFLPEAVASRPATLARFHNEVRVARQITHPNVCRVHDIGEVNGQHFLTMEYVDGEDLASLLTRIGRLAQDKAIEIARQLSAGLAAAHEKGVLHRDLKPANVMLDGRGKVRIMDFGLAALAQGTSVTDLTSGTPAYMAPEQLSGKEVSVQSDLYALGLILYEIFTGRRAYQPAATPTEILRQRETSQPASPVSIVPGLDPSVERVILRCLEKEPRQRPASALAVAAALPGGDPLAAALAAGETPAPELVAAAGEAGGLRPAIAWTLLLAVLAGAGSRSVLMGQSSLLEKVPLEKPPEALAERATEVIHKLGYPDPPADRTYSFSANVDYIPWVERSDHSAGRWEALSTLRPDGITFWYRQGRQALIPSHGMVIPEDPPNVTSGMVTLALDTRGRLWFFLAVPPAVDESKEATQEPDWATAFAEAGLDISRFTPSAPAWLPHTYADQRVAWEGVFPERPETRISVQAASYRGRPVYFEVVGPWSLDWRMKDYNRPVVKPAEKARDVALLVLALSVLVGAGLLARRNLRLQRADRRGAFRVAVFVFCTGMISMAFLGHHVAGFEEAGILFDSLGLILVLTGLTWILYIALEPIVRRRWPQTMITWSRLLAGRLLDPAIGRDILIGGLLLVTIALLGMPQTFILSWFGLPPPRPFLGNPSVLLGTRFFLPGTLQSLSFAMVWSMFLLLGLVLLRILLRKQWLAVAVLFILATLLSSAGGQNIALALVINGVVWAILLALLTRFGLLATVAYFSFGEFIRPYPLSHGLSHWHSGAFLFNMLLVAALAVYAFKISLAGRPMFRSDLLQE